MNSTYKNRSNYGLSNTLQKVIYALVFLTCLLPVISPSIALLAGFILVQVVDNPFEQHTHAVTNRLLKISVVGLGFGINVFSAIHVGEYGFIFTFVSIISVLTAGMLTGSFLKVDGKTSFLISAGTAICGGSAIAALSPVIKANKKQMSVSLGIIFILNAIALFVFPAIGHFLHLPPEKFGLWCALAIHDTSSVVGASARYGSTALQIAITIKLSRTLWIIPVALLTPFLFNTGRGKVQIPYFIGLFILAMFINTFVPFVKPILPAISAISKTGLTITLFLIGTTLSLKSMKQVGSIPLLQGVILWVLISAGALLAIIKLA